MYTVYEWHVHHWEVKQDRSIGKWFLKPRRCTVIVQCCVSSRLVPQCVYGQISTLLFYSRHRQRHAQRMTHSSLDSSYRETRVLGVARMYLEEMPHIVLEPVPPLTRPWINCESCPMVVHASTTHTGCIRCSISLQAQALMDLSWWNYKEKQRGAAKMGRDAQSFWQRLMPANAIQCHPMPSNAPSALPWQVLTLAAHWCLAIAHPLPAVAFSGNVVSTSCAARFQNFELRASVFSIMYPLWTHRNQPYLNHLIDLFLAESSFVVCDGERARLSSRFFDGGHTPRLKSRRGWITATFAKQQRTPGNQWGDQHPCLITFELQYMPRHILLVSAYILDWSPSTVFILQGYSSPRSRVACHWHVWCSTSSWKQNVSMLANVFFFGLLDWRSCTYSKTCVCGCMCLLLHHWSLSWTLDAARKQNAICLGNLAVVKHCSACKSISKKYAQSRSIHHDGQTSFPENIQQGGCCLSASECCISSVCKKISRKYIYIYIYAARFLLLLGSSIYTSSTAQGGGGSLKIGHYRRGELLWCMDGNANPLIVHKLVRVWALLFGVVAMVAVVTPPQLLDVAWCGPVVIVAVVVV